ncbi:MAG TPA: thioesterase family protein [Actinomycetales bacterium]|nr:thioesterase family protein [Actinomycetales bacterium]
MTGSTGITVQRVVEWTDTDASGHYHHSSVIRWVEAAELELYEHLGVGMFGTTPRVHYEVDYLARLWLGDRVDVELSIADVGSSSLRFAFVVRRGDVVAARGLMVCVNSDPHSDGTTPWPAAVRTALTPR